MRTLHWLLIGSGAAALAIAYGYFVRPAALRHERPAREEPDAREPVLGYDGMDQETLMEWLGAADLDFETLERIRRYEQANLRREPVLDALAELLA